MKQVADKKAIHVRAESKAIMNGKVVAAQLDTSLGEIVTLALKLYYRMHLLAKAEKVPTREYILSLVTKLNAPYKKE